MLWLIVALLLAFWAVGFFVANLGDIVHGLLLIVVVLLFGSAVSGIGRRDRVGGGTPRSPSSGTRRADATDRVQPPFTQV